MHPAFWLLPADPAHGGGYEYGEIDVFEAYGAVPDQVRAQEELGRWLCRSGREDEGSALLTESAKIRAELGMPARLPV